MPKMKDAQFDFSILRELRNQRKISLEELSKETGVSFSTLTRIESNQNQPSLATVRLLAEFLGMTPANLLELATTFVVEHAEEKLENLGRLKRRGVTFGDVSLRFGQASAGDKTQKPHQHLGEYQITWVLKGRVVVVLHGQEYELKAGQSIKFDAAYQHELRYKEDTTQIVALVPKRTR